MLNFEKKKSHKQLLPPLRGKDPLETHTQIISFLPLGLTAQRMLLSWLRAGVGRATVGRRSVGRARCQLSRTFSFNFLATILKFLMNVPHHKAHP